MSRAVLALSPLCLANVACTSEEPGAEPDDCPITSGGDTGDATLADFSAATPFVASSAPATGSASVDPSTTQLRFRFSVPMVQESHAFVSVNDLFPEMEDPVWLDEQTLVAEVHLEPGQAYELWVNDPHGIHTHYRSVEGPSAGPYGLVFHTAQ